MRKSSNYRSLPYNPALKERARGLRKAGNLCEVLLWQQFHKGKFRGYDFDRQKIIGNYIVDFYCIDCSVVIEIDGSTHNGQLEYDCKRDEFLKKLKLTIIHIPAADVLYKLESVMHMLYTHPALAESISKDE